MWLLAKLQKDGEIGINAMRSLYLHESGIPGKPTLLGCMRTPARVVLSSHAWRKLSSKEQETNWLGSLLVRGVWCLCGRRFRISCAGTLRGKPTQRRPRRRV